MYSLREKYSIKEMAEFLAVSRQGYYSWLKRSKSLKYYEDKALEELVKEIFYKTYETYGAKSISDELKEQGVDVGKFRVGNIMKRLNHIPKAKRKFKRTTNSDHDKTIAENILSQNFQADRVDQKWVGDITYVWTHEGWAYLAVVVDLFSRKVVGWSLSSTISRFLVISALEKAIKNRKPRPGLIFHSDKGVQYCSNDFRSLLNKHHIIQSMSGKGNCYDNSVAESFFHTLKVERLHGLRFLSRSSLKTCVFEYINVFYNRKRRHSNNKGMSPEKFERINQFNELEKLVS